MVNANNVCTYIEEATIDLLKKKEGGFSLKPWFAQVT